MTDPSQEFIILLEILNFCRQSREKSQSGSVTAGFTVVSDPLGT